MNKAAVRKYYKEKRLALSEKEKLKLDDLLLIQFQQLGFSDIENILTYWPMQQLNEPNVQSINRYLFHSLPYTQFYYPVINSQTNLLDIWLVNDDTTYTANKFGVFEPTNGILANATDVQLVLIPNIICDIYGNRIGYGKGYYDKFLATANNDILKIAINYFEPCEAISDVGPYDVPVDYYVSTTNVYTFE